MAVIEVMDRQKRRMQTGAYDGHRSDADQKDNEVVGVEHEKAPVEVSGDEGLRVIRVGDAVEADADEAAEDELGTLVAE